MHVNHYFDDNVLSIGLDNAAGHHTVGVMNPGRYEFSSALILDASSCAILSAN